MAWDNLNALVSTAQTRRYPMGAAPLAIDDAGIMTDLSDLAITIDPTGTPQLIYVQQLGLGPGNWSILSKRFIGGAWEANFSMPGITIPAQSFVDFAVGYSPDGSLWAYYATGGTPPFSRLMAKRLVPGVTEVRDLVLSNNVPRFPSLALDTQANAQLFFQNGSNLQQVSLVQKI